MNIQDVSNVKKCPGYQHLKRDGTFSASCGYVWDSSPAPHGEGALCPKCWCKPSRTEKRIIMPDGSESKVPEAALNLEEDKNKLIVEEQKLTTEKGQDWDEYQHDEVTKRKKKEKPKWARFGK